jgi:hypothetical protein
VIPRRLTRSRWLLSLLSEVAHLNHRNSSLVHLPLKLFGRYGRKAAFAAVGIQSDQQQQHLNVGLSPQCRDHGYLIFITLNKEELDPAHDYADEIFSDRLIWITRRGVTEDQQHYVNLRLPDTRVSLFVQSSSVLQR